MDGSKNTAEVKRIIDEYSNRLFRMCYVMLKNEQDVQDVLQETLIRYMEKAPEFHDKEHEKAWLFKVCGNLCRDLLRFRKRNQFVELEEVEKYLERPESGEILKEILLLPVKYKMVMHLHYMEGYKTTEIADLTGCSISAVKKRLQRGREMLAQRLKEGS